MFFLSRSEDALQPQGYVEFSAAARALEKAINADGSHVASRRGMPRRLEIHDRREFCKRLASVAACTGGLALLPGCSGGNPSSSIPGSPLSTVAGTVVNGAVTVNIAAGSPLASGGGMALVTSPAGVFLVTRTGTSTFVAVTAQCTHQACVVSYGTGNSYVCPCHGSEFDTSGRVVVGPAIAPLRQFTTQFSNNVLTIA